MTHLAAGISPNRLTPYLLWLITLCAAPPALAATDPASGCNPGQSSIIFLPDVSISRDIRVGSRLQLNELASNNPVQFNCTFSRQSMLGFKTNSPYLTSFNGLRIYATNLPGIGYALGQSATLCPGSDGYSRDNGVSLDKQKYYSCVSVGSGINNPWVAALMLRFYKTTNEMSSGTVNLSGMIASIVRNDGIDLPLEIPLLVNNFNVSATSCSTVNISPNPVQLPDISTSSALPSIGSRYGDTPFRISINCPYTTSLYITFGDRNAVDQTGSILLPDASSTAGGVGIQLWHNGNLIGFGPDSPTPGDLNQFFLDRFSGQQNFLFSASYTRTGPLAAGLLSSTATFTLSYQ